MVGAMIPRRNGPTVHRVPTMMTANDHAFQRIAPRAPTAGKPAPFSGAKRRVYQPG
jgi:hypothetical protein